MLEVISAAIGVGIYGAYKGFSGIKLKSSPLRLLSGHALICAFCLFEMKRRITLDTERQHLWVNTLRTSNVVNDAIDSGTPKYLLANLPCLVAAYSGALASIGSLALVFRR